MKVAVVFLNPFHSRAEVVGLCAVNDDQMEQLETLKARCADAISDLACVVLDPDGLQDLIAYVEETFCDDGDWPDEDGPPFDAATRTGMYDHDDGC